MKYKPVIEALFQKEAEAEATARKKTVQARWKKGFRAQQGAAEFEKTLKTVQEIREQARREQEEIDRQRAELMAQASRPSLLRMVVPDA